MKLIGLQLKNFRRYKSIKFDLSQNLHMIVGFNDIGKSTILEALDIFFNGNSALNKITINDLNIVAKDNDDYNIEITCVFSLDENEKVVIDSQYEIAPKDEYLLNENGNIEITKEYNTHNKTIKPSVYLNCYLPDCIDEDILTKKQSELKKIFEQECGKQQIVDDRRINSNLRKAIYAKRLEQNKDSTYSKKRIDTSSILNDKEFYTNLEKLLPDYYLFKADRENNTSDDEVQNPLSLAVKDVLSSQEVKEKLQEIEDIVNVRINEINGAIIEQMQKFSSRIGNKLKANTTTNWVKAINNDINDANNIPINKKGSGIRRLLLLSYLMVDAKRKSFLNKKKNIIYAIEEPETALHPDLQKRFIKELYSMAYNHDYSRGDEIPTNGDELTNYKILLTTHTPNYIAFATQEEVIYLSEDTNGEISELTGDIEKDRIKNEMGLLPNPNYGFVIFVEGDSDVSFMRNIGKIPELKAIFDIEKSNVDLIAVRGSNLLKSIEKDFYKDLPVVQFHLYDGDCPKYKKFVQEEINNGKHSIWYGFTTQRKEIEYFIPPRLIDITLGTNLCAHVDRYENENFNLINYLLQAEVSVPPLCGIKKAKNPETALKNYLNKTVLRTVDKKMLEEFGVFDEIKSWFEKMKELENNLKNE